MITNSNIFIDFQVILDSQKKELKTELDTIIQLQNRIYLWSKKFFPEQMRLHCLKTEMNLDDKEIEIHKECYKLRNVDLLSYQEISDKLGISPKRIGFFSKVSPNKKWTLDDWVIDYFNKDSSVYSKVDFVIDSDPKIVERFAKIGIKGNIINKL
jgi:hypothetical protein